MIYWQQTTGTSAPITSKMCSIYMQKMIDVFFSEASRAFVTAYMFSPRERAFWYFKYSSKKVANIARLPKISNVRILFTIHNGAKSTTAIDLNKRRDYHNNCQTTLVRPRFVHVSHFFTQFIFEIFLCITQAGLLCVFS